MNRKFLGGVVLSLFMLNAFAAFAASEDITVQTPDQDPERVLAKVAGQEIKEKDVDQVLASLGPQSAAYNNEQGRDAILNELVAIRLFALSGVKQGVDQSSEYKAIMENFGAQTLARITVEKMMQDVAASDEESKKFYDDNPAQFTTYEEIRASHILLSDDVTSADTAGLILDELKKGTSFDVLAERYSTDPSVEENGGDLGFFPRGQMIPEFDDAAFALKEPGDLSAPVKTVFGWHIIRLEERKPSALLSYDEVKPQIAQYLSSEKKSRKYQEELEVLRKEYGAEIFFGTGETSGDVK